MACVTSNLASVYADETVLRAVNKALSFSLLMVMAWVGLSSLAISGASSPPTHLAPCHQQMPASPSPQPASSDHSCCAVGHNQALLSGKLAIPPLRVAQLIESAMVLPGHDSGDLRESCIPGFRPPDTANQPIRI